MKKTMKLILTAMLLFAMTVSFAACGGDAGETSNEVTKVDAEKAAKVAEYVKANQSAVEETVNSDVYSVKLEADGDKVVYVFQYKDIDKSPELEATLKEQTEKVEDQLKEVLTGIQTECEEVSAVVYKYLDSQGEVIYEKEIK